MFVIQQNPTTHAQTSLAHRTGALGGRSAVGPFSRKAASFFCCLVLDTIFGCCDFCRLVLYSISGLDANSTFGLFRMRQKRPVAQKHGDGN